MVHEIATLRPVSCEQKIASTVNSASVALFSPICFRIFALSCFSWSAVARWRPSLPTAIVTEVISAVFI
jgi:hypothetical protein